MYVGKVTGILTMQTELKVSLNYCITNLQNGRRCYCIVTALLEYIYLLQNFRVRNFHMILKNNFSGALLK